MSDELLRQHMEQDRENFAKLETKVDALSVEVRALHDDIVRYKGFVGGIVFLVTAVAAAVALFLQWWK